MTSNIVHIPIRTPEGSPQVPLSTPILPLPLSALQRAHAKLVADVSRLRTEPALDLPSFPSPDEIRSVGSLLLGLVNAVDPFIAEVGKELRRSVDSGADLSLFVGQLLGSLDGNALGEIERLAESQEEVTSAVWLVND